MLRTKSDFVFVLVLVILVLLVFSRVFTIKQRLAIYLNIHMLRLALNLQKKDKRDVSLLILF